MSWIAGGSNTEKDECFHNADEQPPRSSTNRANSRGRFAQQDHAGAFVRYRLNPGHPTATKASGGRFATFCQETRRVELNSLSQTVAVEKQN
jgi:hypothetical protein